MNEPIILNDHNVFGVPARLPGEDKELFKKFFLDLFEEYEPLGELEEACLIAIGQLLWRSRRFDVLSRAGAARDKYKDYLKGSSFEAEKGFEYIVARDNKRMWEVSLANLAVMQELAELNEKIENTGKEMMDRFASLSDDTPAEREASLAATRALAEKKADRAVNDFNLALLGPAVSPENYRRSLKLHLEIWDQIDVFVNRLNKLQKQRQKKTAVRPSAWAVRILNDR